MRTNSGRFVGHSDTGRSHSQVDVKRALLQRSWRRLSTSRTGGGWNEQTSHAEIRRVKATKNETRGGPRLMADLRPFAGYGTTLRMRVCSAQSSQPASGE